MRKQNNKLRHDEYLNYYHFYHNSIDFRIRSSKSIEKYKNVQSFQLNQLLNGKFFFPQEIREILLLKFDMWSRWLMEVENFFVERSGHSREFAQEDLETIFDLANKTTSKYTEIIQDEPTKKYFDQEFSKIWLETHETAYAFMLKDISTYTGTYHDVFDEIINVLCEIMQYTLTELHELVELKDSDSAEIFVVVSPFCLRFFNKTGSCLISERVRTYQKYFKFDTVWFKNYTDDSIPQGLIETVEQTGVKIDYKRSFFN